MTRYCFKFLMILLSILWPLRESQAKTNNQNLKEANIYLKKYNTDGARDNLYEAVKYLKKASEENDAEACYILSEIYDLKDLPNVRIHPRDVSWVENSYLDTLTYDKWPTHKIAFEYLNKACDLDNQKAILKLACEYAEWQSYYPIERNIDKALELFLRLDSKDSFVEYKISKIYWLKNQDEDAIRWMKKASESDGFHVLPELGWLYNYSGNVPKAIEAYEDWIRIDKYKSLKTNNVKIGNINTRTSSQYIKNYQTLLYLYTKHNDWSSAINLSKQMTSEIKTLTSSDITDYNRDKQNEIDLIWDLLDIHTHRIEGINYNEGRLKLDSIAIAHDDFRHINLVRKYFFIIKDYNKAFHYLTSYPIESDHNLLGRCYYYGLATKINYKDAIHYFSLCKDPDSLYHLGLCYYNGQGIENIDYDRAFEYFDKASTDTYYPSIGAMEMLSRCYRFGRGCGKDEEKANYWLEEAATASEKAKEAQNALMNMR